MSIGAAPDMPHLRSFATPVAPMIPDHPDAVLLAAWDRYVAAYRCYVALPETWSDKESAPHLSAVYREADVIESTPARTAHGIAIKLQVHLLTYCEVPGIAAAILDGAAPPVFEEPRDVALWALLDDVRSHLPGC